ncbi:MAG: F0F1 ATP synthase subunit delta [Sphingosinicella sp.]
MDISSGIEASLEGRYASALFVLARDSRTLATVEQSLATLKDALDQSQELRALAASPLIGRDDKVKAVLAAADALKLDPTTCNFVGVLARNGRLAKLDAAIRAFRRLAAAHRGELSATVTSARPLDDAQVAAIRRKLKDKMGREIAVDLKVDPAILGGLIVRIGSRMIDGSIRTKLHTLAVAMKG